MTDEFKADPQADLDNDTPPWERQAEPPRPAVGTSDLAKGLEEKGVFDALKARHEAQRDDAQQKAVEDSQGFSFDSLRKSAHRTLTEMEERLPSGMAGGIAALKAFTTPPDKEGMLGPDLGMLKTEEERKAAAKSELETREWSAPLARKVASSLPEDFTHAASEKRVAEGRADVEAGRTVEGYAKIAAEYSPIAWITRFAKGSLDSVADKQEKALAAAQSMARGEIALPEKSWWRDKVESGAATIANFSTATMIQYMGIASAYLANMHPGMHEVDPWDNNVTKFGRDLEKYVNELFPGDKTRQYEFSKTAVQGIGSAITFGLQGKALGALLGGGPMAVDAAIALAGAAAQTPEEFGKVTEALKKGNATERDRLIVFLANSALGATEVFGIAPTIAGRGRLGARSAAQRGLEQLFEEGGQEISQQYGQNLTAKYTYNPSQDPYEGVAEGGLVGMLTGGIFGAAYSQAKGRAEAEEGIAKARALGFPGNSGTKEPDDRTRDKRIREAKVRSGTKTDVEPTPELPSDASKPEQAPGAKFALPPLEAMPKGAEGAAMPPPLPQVIEPQVTRQGPPPLPEEEPIIPSVAAMAERPMREAPREEQPDESPKDRADRLDTELAEKFKVGGYGQADPESLLGALSAAVGLAYRDGTEYLSAEWALANGRPDIAEEIHARMLRRAEPRKASPGHSDNPEIQADLDRKTAEIQAELDAETARRKHTADSIGNLIKQRTASASQQQRAKGEAPRTAPKEGPLAEAEVWPQFQELIGGKTPASQWASAMGLTNQQLKPLLKRAVKQGLLRQTASGQYRRTTQKPKVAAAPAPAPAIAPLAQQAEQTAQSLAIPSDMRLARAIELIERQRGKPVSRFVRNAATRIEQVLGKPEFDASFEKLKKAKGLTKDAALDLGRIVGYGAEPKTKAQALKAIAARHTAELANAQRSDVRQGQGTVPEAGVPAAVPADERGGNAETASGGNRPGSGRDVVASGSADGERSGTAGGIRGAGESLGADTGSGAGTGQPRPDTRPAEPVAPPPLPELTPEQKAEIEAEKAAKAAEIERQRQNRVARNYAITDADMIGKGGPKAKVRANLEALRVLKRMDDEGRTIATDEEKRALVKYVGWGAFAQDVFATHKDEWARERAELQNLLTPEEFASARRSTLNAHYTSPEVIKGMWQALAHLGFKGGRVIEPSAGIGHFIGLQPEAMRPDTAWTAVELDTVSGRITKALYGAADVRIGGFEEQKWPADYFDLAISNVPFGDYKVDDPAYNKLNLFIHDYFFVKSLDLVRPGGVVAFITSSGTLDKVRDTARREIEKRGTFLGAIRLPGGSQGAFKANAGTDVTTDIIFVRKRMEGEPTDFNAEWQNLEAIKTPEGSTKINAYFAKRPEMMLGKMRLQGTMYGPNQPALIGSTADIDAKIAAAAEKGLPADAMPPRGSMVVDNTQAEEIDDVVGEHVKEGGFYLNDGKLFQKVVGVGRSVGGNKQDLARIRDFIGIRDTVNQMLAKQAAGDRAGMDELRLDLAAAYDSFVEEHGPINLTFTTEQKRKDGKVITIKRRPNFRPFMDDPDAYKVAAIELYDEKTSTARKAAIFTEDIVAPYSRPEITGPADALAVSLNETGGVDMKLIAKALGTTEERAAKTLGDAVFLNPRGERWETAAQYLSGDVVRKLEEAKLANDVQALSDRLDQAEEDLSILSEGGKLKEKTEKAGLYDRNIKALEAVQPLPLSRVEITVPFGASWVPETYISAFLQERVGVPGMRVSLNEATKQWRVIGGGYSESANAQWGTARVGVPAIVESALNSQPIMVWDKMTDGSRVRNTKAEEEARAKVQLLKEAFTGQTFPGAPAAIGGWVWEDEARAAELEAIYNRSFNRIVKQQFDGSHLTFPGLARVVSFPDGSTGTINLTPARTSAIWRIIQNGNTLIDHVVGAGKTWTSIMAVMEMKRLGQIRRPMFVVPNHMLQQFSNEFLQAYPGAKLLIATKESMSAAKRKEFAAKAAAEKWDGIIITHSAFGRLKMNPSAYVDYYQEAIDQLEAAMVKAAKEEGKKSPTVKDIEKAKKRLEAKLAKLTETNTKDEGVTFEELGVDHLTVDEAHLFKNLWFYTRHTRVRGISNASESQRATDLYIKIRHLEKSRPGRSALFLTGTPLSNTMAEVYTMMRYLQHDTLNEYGIGEFDSWAQTFGVIETKTELAPNGREFRDTTSFSKFVNIPELSTLYGRIADTQTAESLKLPRPTLKGGKPVIIESEMSPGEEAYLSDLIKQMEELKGKKPEKGDPNFLSLFTKGLQVGTDIRLVDPQAPRNPDGKIAKAVTNVYRIWEDGNADEKAPNKAQLIFLDMGVPGSRAVARMGETAVPATTDEWLRAMGREEEAKIEEIRRKLSEEGTETADDAETVEPADEETAVAEAMLQGKFNLYEDIKQGLIAKGVPADQIAFIHDAKNDEAKGKLFEAVRSGKVRILLGSSAKMGVGTNVQKQLIAMHHIDAPWKPADVEQRDGRILRQGNKNPEVQIYRYITKRSFDSYRWQILENKSHFIGQFRAGARGVRIAEDIDAPLPEAAELKAAATGDPRIVEHAEASRQLRVLEAQRAAHAGAAVRARNALTSTHQDIDRLRKLEKREAADAAKVQDLRGENFTVSLDILKKPQTFTDRKEAGKQIKAYIMRLADQRGWYGGDIDLDLGTISGFNMVGTARRAPDGTVVVGAAINGQLRYDAPSQFVLNEETNPVGVMQAWERLVAKVPGYVELTRERIARAESDIPKLEQQSKGTPFPKMAELDEVRARVEKLGNELKSKVPEAVVRAEAEQEADYVDQALTNLTATSRTASGEIDTSASPGKAGQMAEGLTGDAAAKAATENFERVIRDLFRERDTLAKLTPSALADRIDQVALAINKGILKEGALFRTDNSPKYAYTDVSEIELARDQFAAELWERLNDPTADPVETAAWIEWRVDVTDHLYGDASTTVAHALAAIPLMRAGRVLPQYDARIASASNTIERYPSEGGENYLDSEWAAFFAHYRTLVLGEPGSRTDRSTWPVSPLPVRPEEDLKPQEDIVNPVDRSATPEAKLAQIKKLTAENVPLLERITKEIDEKLGTQSKPNVKDDMKILEKAKRPSILAKKPWHNVEHIRDTLRFKTVIGRLDQVRDAFEILMKNGVGVVKIDTPKLFEPKEWGWRIVAFDLRMPNGQLVEWYLPIDELEKAKKSGGHHLFENWRNEDPAKLSPEQYERYLDDMRASNALYDDALARALKRMGYEEETEARASWSKLSASLPEIMEKFSYVSAGEKRGAPGASAGYQWPEASLTNLSGPSPTMRARPSSLSIDTSGFGIPSTSTSNIDVQEAENNRSGAGNTGPSDSGNMLPAFASQNNVLPRLADLRLKPEVQARIPEFYARLREEAARMLPANVAFKVVDGLQLGGKELGGKLDLNEGAVVISAAVGPQQNLRHLLHETAGHVLRNLYTQEEWQVLLDRAKKTGADEALAPYLADYQRLYEGMGRRQGLTGEALRSQVADRLDQERVAILAERWVTGTQYGTKVNSLLDRILKFIEAIRNAIRGMGLQTADDIFERVKSGEIAGRGPATFDAAKVAKEVFAPKPDTAESLLDTPVGQITQREVETIENALLAIDAYHGSRHQFDRFDVSKVGTGEGAQAYGHGLYFAQKEGTARWYMTAGTKQLMPPPSLALHYMQAANNDLDAAIKAAKADLEKTPRFEWHVAIDNFIADPVIEGANKRFATEQEALDYAKSHLDKLPLPNRGWLGRKREYKFETQAGRSTMGKVWAHVFEYPAIKQPGGKFKYGGINVVQTEGNEHRKVFDALDALENWSLYSTEEPGGGNLYKVTIEAEPSEMLDWDMPLSEQTKAVRDAVAKVFGGKLPAKMHAMTGGEIHNELSMILKFERPRSMADASFVSYRQDEEIQSVQQQISRRLLEAGIPGIRYFDRLSRSKGEGTQNFVIFSHDNVKITHKNGEPVTEDQRQLVLDGMEEQQRQQDAGAANMLPAFAGRNAETVDLRALNRAEDLEELGAPREQIWSETGFFRGVDGQWRFEINDSGMRVRIGQGFGFERGSPVIHAELVNAYPYFDEAVTIKRDEEEKGYAEPGNIVAAGPTRKDRKSVAAHEIQHVIQRNEGFAAGGNWRIFTAEEIEAERQRLKVAESRKAQERPASTDPMQAWAMVDTSIPVEDLSDRQIAMRLYKRLAGEVEARAVQARLNMTPEQRREKAPWESYDVPEDQQIVIDQTEREFRGSIANESETDIRSFAIPGYEGKVETVEDEDGNRIRAYRIVGKEGQERSIPTASLILSEQENGAWEASSYAIGANNDDAGLLAKLLDAAEADVGVPLAPTGWLSPSMMQRQSMTNPAAVEGYQPAGDRAPGVMGTAKAAMMANAARENAEPMRVLDMSPAARKARAEAMGFDTSKVWYHGTIVRDGKDGKRLGDFRVFDRMATVDIVGRQPSMDTVGIWFDESPDERQGAGAYAGKEGAIYPVYLKLQNPWRPKSFDEFLEEFHASAGRKMPATRQGVGSAEELRADLKAQGYDGIEFGPGMVDFKGQGIVRVVFDPEQVRSVNAAFDPAEEDSPNMLAAFADTSPKVSQPGETVPAKPVTIEGGENENVRGLSEIIRDIKETLGMPVTQGVYGLRVRNPKTGRSWRFPFRLRGQYDKKIGIARIKTVTDIEAIAHEGGHHLEVQLGKPLEEWKTKHAAELTERAAPDLAMPPIQSARGFSGLELDADTQQLLLRAARAMSAHRADVEKGTQNRSAFKLGPQQAFDPDIQREAATAWAALVRRVGRPRAEFMVKDLADLGLDQNIYTQQAEAYVASRYSRDGQPKPAAKPAPSYIDVSEGFAEFFAKYLTDGEALRQEQPALYEAFEDFLDAENPGLLMKLERLQLVALQQDYRKYVLASAVQRGIADVATWQDPTTWEQTKEFYRTDDKAEVLRQWLGQMSFEITNKTGPILKTQQALLRIADANGVRSPDGRPLSLLPGQDAYKIARLLAGADKIGHTYIMKGVPDYDSLETAGPSLHDALVEAMGGTSRFQWTDKAIRQFGLYLEARRAVVEWDLWEAKKQQIADTQATLEQAQEDRRTVADSRQKARGRLERAREAAIRNAVLLQDRERMLSSADTRLVNEQERIDKIRADLEEALQAIDDGSDQAKAVRDRKQDVLSRAEKKQQALLAEVEALSTEVDELSTQRTILESIIEQQKAELERLDATVGAYDEAFEEMRKELANLEKQGAQRPPTRKSKEEYAHIISELEAANPSYQRAAQMVYDWQHSLLTLEWKAGKWTDEAYQRLTERKDWYVPFMRDLDDVMPSTKGAPGSVMAKRFSESKRFTGSARDIINPIEAMARRSYETAAAVQFNDMVKALTALSERAGPGGAGFIERVQKQEVMANNERTFEHLKQLAIGHGMNEDDAHALISSMETNFDDAQVHLLWDPDNLGPNRPPIVPLWENGERKLVRLNDPVMGRRLFDSMNALGREQTSIWIKAIGYPAAVLRAGVTMHPAFVLSNILGDMQASWVLTGAMPVITQVRGAFHLLSTNPRMRRLFDMVGLPQSTVAEWYSRVGGISGGQNVAALRATRSEHKLTELRENGYRVMNTPGLLGLATTLGGIFVGGAVGGIVGATAGGAIAAAASRAIYGKGAEEAFAQLSEASETVTRLGVAAMAYKRVKRLNPQVSDVDAAREAAFTARDVLDFDRNGAKFGTLMKLIPFLNANVQGVSAAYRKLFFMEGDRGRINMRKAALFLRWQIAGDTAAQAKLSEGDRQAIRDGARVWVNIMILSAVGAGIFFLYKDDPEYDDIADEKTRATHWVFKLGGTWFRVKKPFELAALANATEALLETYIKGDPRLGEKLWTNFKETHLPPAIPQTMRLVGDIRSGYDSQNQRPIVRQSLQRLPPYMQFDAYTSEFSKQWAMALHKIGMDVSPAILDYALNNSIAYWGREIGVSSNYFLGRNRESPKWTDVPIYGTVYNRVTIDPSRRSASVDEFWKTMGQGKGKYDQALAGYDNVLKSGNTETVKTYLAGLTDAEREYAVVTKHLSKTQAEAHPLNRAKSIISIDNTMRREMILGQLLDTSVRKAPEVMKLSPVKQTEVHDILGRLSAIEAWNSLHDLGHPGWSQREVRDPQVVLDELKAAEPRVYEEMIRRRERAKVGDYAADKAKWSDVQAQAKELIKDEDMLGLAWRKAERKRRTPAPSLFGEQPGAQKLAEDADTAAETAQTVSSGRAYTPGPRASDMVEDRRGEAPAAPAQAPAAAPAARKPSAPKQLPKASGEDIVRLPQ